jgi:hypothetical protein
MTREHRHALDGLDAGMVSFCLVDPEAGISAATAACSAGTDLGGEHFPPRTGYRTLADGIHIGGDWTTRGALFVLTWREITALARDTPRPLREALRESRRRLSEHQVTRPTYSIRLSDAGRSILDDEVREWERAQRALRGERDALVAQALGLTDTEPEDLLELLAAGG